MAVDQMTTVARTPEGWVHVKVHVAEKEGKGIICTGLDRSTTKLTTQMLRVVLPRWTVGDIWLEFEKENLHIDITPQGPEYSGPQMVAGIIASVIDPDKEGMCVVGSVTLGGDVLPVENAVQLSKVVPDNYRLYLPEESAKEVALHGRDVGVINDFPDIVRAVLKENWSAGMILKGSSTPQETNLDIEIDFKDIIGQEKAKRWFMISVSGRHNIFAVGPPGVGKSRTSKAAAGLQPLLFDEEFDEVSRIHALAGIELNGRERPFQFVTNRVSASGLFGGGSTTIKPGAVSIAHRGILHVDEFLELTHSKIESLRSVLEDKSVPIVRTNFKTVLPADFQLIATANRCPCSFLGDTKNSCTCTKQQIRSYQGKMSGAMVDRIDIITHFETVEPRLIFEVNDRVPTKNIREQVSNAWARQFERFGTWNACASTEDIHALPMTTKAKECALKIADMMNMRSFTRTLRLARTIADINDHGDITDMDIVEAAIAARTKI